MTKIGKLLITKGEAKGATCIVENNQEVSIGRNKECNIPVPDIRLSRIHCVVRNVSGEFELLDNNSSNGTFCNGAQVHICTELKSGDSIEIGDTEIQFLAIEGE